MIRQIISLTKTNHKWLKETVAAGKYISKSELINKLVSLARNEKIDVDWMRAKLQRAEKRGFTQMSKSEILMNAKTAKSQ